MGKHSPNDLDKHSVPKSTIIQKEELKQTHIEICFDNDESDNEKAEKHKFIKHTMSKKYQKSSLICINIITFSLLFIVVGAILIFIAPTIGTGTTELSEADKTRSFLESVETKMVKNLHKKRHLDKSRTTSVKETCFPSFSSWNTSFYPFLNATFDGGYDFSFWSKRDQVFWKNYKLNRPKNDYIRLHMECNGKNYYEGDYGFVVIELNYWLTGQPIVLDYKSFQNEDFVNGNLTIGTVEDILKTPDGIASNSIDYNLYTTINSFNVKEREKIVKFSQKFIVILFKVTKISSNLTSKLLTHVNGRRIYLNESEFDQLIEESLDYFTHGNVANSPIVKKLHKKRNPNEPPSTSVKETCFPSFSSWNTSFYPFLNATYDGGYDFSFWSKRDQVFWKNYKLNRPKNDYVKLHMDCNGKNYYDGDYGFVVIELNYWLTGQPIVLDYKSFQNEDFVNGNLTIGTVEDNLKTPDGIASNSIDYDLYTTINSFNVEEREKIVKFSQKFIVILFKVTEISLNLTSKLLTHVDGRRIYLNESELDQLIEESLDYFTHGNVANSPIVEKLEEKFINSNVTRDHSSVRYNHVS